MDFKEMFFLTLSSIKERRTRTILTILMITMGCGLLVSLSSLTQGLISFVEQNFKKILPNQIIISNSDKIQQSNMENIQNKLQVLFDKNLSMVGKRIPFDYNTIKYLENMTGIDSVDPAFQGMLMLKYDNKTKIANAIATNFTSLGNIIPDFENKFMTDPSNKGDHIIIPQKISESLFLSQKQKNNITVNDIGEIDSLSKTSGRDNSFNVMDIINSTGNPIIDNSVFIETKRGKEILNKSDDYDILFLTYDDINKVDGIVKTLQKHFNNQVTILNSLEIMRTLTKFIVGVSTFISSIAVFSLIVGAIGIV